MYYHRRSHKSQRCPCSASVLENTGFGPLVKAEKRSHQCRGLVSYRPIKSEYNSVTIKYKGGGGKKKKSFFHFKYRKWSSGQEWIQKLNEHILQKQDCWRVRLLYFLAASGAGGQCVDQVSVWYFKTFSAKKKKKRKDFLPDQIFWELLNFYSRSRRALWIRCSDYSAGAWYMALSQWRPVGHVTPDFPPPFPCTSAIKTNKKKIFGLRSNSVWGLCKSLGF